MHQLRYVTIMRVTINIIRALHKTNGGLSSVRNYGVNYAKGKYVTFVDSDDYVSATYISDMIDLKDKYKSDMVCTRV